MRKAIAAAGRLVFAMMFVGAMTFGVREAWAAGHPIGNSEHAKKLMICNPDDCSVDCAQVGQQGRCIVGQCFCNPG